MFFCLPKILACSRCFQNFTVGTTVFSLRGHVEDYDKPAESDMSFALLQDPNSRVNMPTVSQQIIKRLIT